MCGLLLLLLLDQISFAQTETRHDRNIVVLAFQHNAKTITDDTESMQVLSQVYRDAETAGLILPGQQ